MDAGISKVASEAGHADRKGEYPYTEPRVFALGSLDQIQAYYHGAYYDGPDSWNSYDG